MREEKESVMEHTRHENVSGNIWRKKGNQPEEIGDPEEHSGRGRIRAKFKCG